MGEEEGNQPFGHLAVKLQVNIPEALPSTCSKIVGGTDGNFCNFYVCIGIIPINFEEPFRAIQKSHERVITNPLKFFFLRAKDF